MMICLNTFRVMFLSFLCFLCLITKAVSGPFWLDCPNTTTYSPTSTYKTNLNTLLSVLTFKANTTNGFFNFTTGLNSPDVVHGLFSCRCDVSKNDCQNCVVTASKEILKLCPTQKRVIVWYDNCLLRYSNRYMFSILDQLAIAQKFDPLDLKDWDRLRRVLGERMEDIANWAANHQSGKKFGPKRAVRSLLSIGFELDDSKIISKATASPLASVSPPPPGPARSSGVGLAGKTWGLKVCSHQVYGSIPLAAISSLGQCPYMVFTLVLNGGLLKWAVELVPGIRNGGIISQVLIAVIVSIVVSVLLFILAFYFLRRKAKKKDIALQEDTSRNEITEVQSLQYDLIALQAATNNFSDANKIGEGGFGVVYKGILPNGQEIAVKRLSQNSSQGVEEFKNEVLLVAKFQHRNLVRLLGYCLEGKEKILIYEFVPNRSLDYFLFDPQKQEMLDWSIRYKIIKGVVRGILYLHEDSQVNIIHRDLKTSNILLDTNMNAKISDFGTARIFGVDKSQENTSKVVGTYGYMSPEYVLYGQYSVKSDVFSFGVLLLEIISGKKNNSFYQSDYADDLLSYAWKLWNDGRPLELMDPTLEGFHSTNEVLRCIHIGLLCVQEDLNARPTMATVLLMLNSYSYTMSVPQQPAFHSLSKTRSNALKGLESGESTWSEVPKGLESDESTWSEAPKGLQSNESTTKSMPWLVNEATITKMYPR
ncbi:hypothetical protein TEA_025841 [Camellia sinensis var. sinensis]|uniref:Cysteine-rich receptor-like protein kinase 10 n=1 Tax=Camellia sinensis var. sinensis TaxID=542762 RepID=A0A4S4DXE8_CAMSN|nr:hypothetical protein TEA_025841 [Camellia sinensis var. sinensis]